MCEYERNYGLLHTFEPFSPVRPGVRGKSPRSTLAPRCWTLATGRVIAEEPISSTGFCPVGFYVPDWRWDLHDRSVIGLAASIGTPTAGSPARRVRVCVGVRLGRMDSSWKVQHLDLTGIQSGVIRREERFGYVELATDGYRSPCFSPEGFGRCRAVITTVHQSGTMGRENKCFLRCQNAIRFRLRPAHAMATSQNREFRVVRKCVQGETVAASDGSRMILSEFNVTPAAAGASFVVTSLVIHTATRRRIDAIPFPSSGYRRHKVLTVSIAATFQKPAFGENFKRTFLLLG